MNSVLGEAPKSETKQNKKLISISRSALILYLLMAGASALIKIPLAFYNYRYGFLCKNWILVCNDSYQYIMRATEDTFSYFVFGQHWLYEYLNRIMYMLIGQADPVYLYMSFFNIFLSLLLPLVFLPAINVICPPSKRNLYFITLSAFLLFWPTAIYLSTQNMKDILLAFLTAIYISQYICFSSPNRRATFIEALGLLISLYFIYSLRTYLAGIILLVTVIHFCWIKRNVRSVIIVVLLVFISPVGSNITYFANNNWIFNEDARAAFNDQIQESGSEPIKVYLTPASITYGFLRTIVSPIPSVINDNIYDFLLRIRTILVTMLLLFFCINIYSWNNPIKLWMIGVMLILLLFFAINPTFAGPRQIFSSVELIFLLITSYFLVEKRKSPNLMASILAGLMVNSFFIVFTAREWIF